MIGCFREQSERTTAVKRMTQPLARSLALGLLALAAAEVALSSSAAAADETWRGVVRALHQPTLSSELAAMVARVHVREGQRFTKGETLLEFDCRRQRHELAALAAGVREARTVVATNEYLQTKGAANRNDVEIAQARLEKASAEWAALNERLAGCRIVAPFDGSVVELSVGAHELPQPNRPLMTLTSIDQLELEIIVPSRRLAALRPGSFLSFRIDETGATYRARVLRSGGAVDAVSQTLKIYAEFTEPTGEILPGMSGTASPATEDR